MFTFSPRPPAIVGHRGAPRMAPENSLASFRAAVAAGASWVELDARRTADDRIAVIHDPATVDGVAVVERRLDELRPHGVVGLEDVFADLPAGVGADVELKNLPGEPDYDEEQRLASLVARVVAAHGGGRPLVASSFNPLALGALRQERADLPLGLLTVPVLELSSGVELAVEFGVDAVFPHVTAPDLTPAAVAAAHARGLAVMVWTVDEPAQARRLAEAGVDALCTNEPALLAAAL
ncbi:MAG TPA: glycerophosphodiester phosphodiesterase [Egibacteraceae bacterium]|nr:glycerophosphodiester phosphodiesterase [Egibacteraceae bacterium]